MQREKMKELITFPKQLNKERLRKRRDRGLERQLDVLLPDESTRASAPKKTRERKAHRLSEAVEQRKERLTKQRDRDRARRAANTAEGAELFIPWFTGAHKFKIQITRSRMCSLCKHSGIASYYLRLWCFCHNGMTQFSVNIMSCLNS